MKIDTNMAKFLDNSVDIVHKDILTIDSEGKWQQSIRFKKEDGTPTNEFRINLKLKNGEIRNTTFNWTNVKMLVEAFGDETAEWVGREVRAWKTKSEKAKIGYSFLFAPIDWSRDDTGEWEKGSAGKASDNQDAVKTNEVDSVQIDEIRAEDIPF